MTSTLGEFLPSAARRFGDGTAIIVEDKAFTFNELHELSNRIANGLTASGVQPGDRVTLYGHNCWEWLVAYYGIVKTGAVINPINVMLTAEEVRYAVGNLGARAVVASQDKGAPLLDLKGGTRWSGQRQSGHWPEPPRLHRHSLPQQSNADRQCRRSVEGSGPA